jgi:hypothetical protein
MDGKRRGERQAYEINHNNRLWLSIQNKCKVQIDNNKIDWSLNYSISK